MLTFQLTNSNNEVIDLIAENMDGISFRMGSFEETLQIFELSDQVLVFLQAIDLGTEFESFFYILSTPFGPDQQLELIISSPEFDVCTECPSFSLDRIILNGSDTMEIEDSVNPVISISIN